MSPATGRPCKSQRILGRAAVEQTSQAEGVMNLNEQEQEINRRQSMEKMGKAANRDFDHLAVTSYVALHGLFATPPWRVVHRKINQSSAQTHLETHVVRLY